MVAPHRPSPFSELASVEAWDAWFRWRDRVRLHDTTIEDTWRRVATALADVEADAARARWWTRCMDAFTRWRLLPDARLIAAAGTGRCTWDDGSLYAVLNAAMFVPRSGGPEASIDLATLADCAELAVRVLDNAAAIANVGSPRLRIGIMGIADALALLGLPYNSDAGRARAASIAKTVAEGCLRGSISLATTRGARAGGAFAIEAHAALRGTPSELLRDAARHGVRHARLTAITSQPKLALLANDVADAADPLLGPDHLHRIATTADDRTIRSSGYALITLRDQAGERHHQPDTLAELPWRAQLAMRAALQPWLDEPIAYPLLAIAMPDREQRDEARRQAALHGLGKPVWRDPVASLQRLPS